MTAKRKGPVDPARSSAIKLGMLQGAHRRGKHTEPAEGCPLCVAERGQDTIRGELSDPLRSDPTKTPEEREREHQAALEEAQRADTEAKTPFPKVGDQDGDIVLHVVNEGGFTVLSKVWFRGEEIRIKRGSPTWDLTVDRNGHSWTEMSEDEQIERYGEVKFRIGPWPYGATGKTITDEQYLTALSQGDHEAVRRYEKQQQRQAAPKAPVSR